MLLCIVVCELVCNIFTSCFGSALIFLTFFIRSFSSAMCEKIASMVQGECMDIYCVVLCCVVLCMCIHSIAIIPTGLSTPVEMKLKLISILVHMHHDLHSASQVSHFTTELWPSTVSFSLPQARQLCIQLLSSYASLAFVCVILQTLTKLAVATLVHVSDQVSNYVYCHKPIQMFMIA